jgi:hypothetical protein
LNVNSIAILRMLGRGVPILDIPHPGSGSMLSTSHQIGPLTLFHLSSRSFLVIELCRPDVKNIPYLEYTHIYTHDYPVLWKRSLLDSEIYLRHYPIEFYLRSTSRSPDVELGHAQLLPSKDVAKDDGIVDLVGKLGCRRGSE